MAKKVLIIGCGVSGLPAIKCCVEEGLEPVCVERTSSLGGLWKFTEDVHEGQACVMRSTVINSSKEMSSYSDFPPPAEFPNYMHNTKVLEYLHQYADRFDLKKYVRFNTEVVVAKLSADPSRSDRWDVALRDNLSGTTRHESYDALMVCTGHHAETHRPDFPGMEQFEGKILHSHDYKDHKGFEGKRVVVVGMGNSAMDVAVDLCSVSEQTYLSTRRGGWIVSRVSDNGYPADLVVLKRMARAIGDLLPKSLLNSQIEKKANKRFDHQLYGIRPKHRFLAQHVTVNDAFPNVVACGSLVIKSDIKKMTKTGVEFVDGSCEEHIDAIIMCTGYKFGFPFIDEPSMEVVNNEVNLYKYVFPPDLDPASLAVIGCIQPLGSIVPISEMQCRWAARVFKGVTKLPPTNFMWEDIRHKKEQMSKRFVKSPRHTIQVDYIPIMDEIARQFGVKPDLVKMFFSDFQLWKQVVLGPATPYQYRLEGPGRWEGARKAIMTQWDRVETPYRTREAASVPEQSNALKIVLLVLVLAIVIRFCGIF